MVIDLTKTNTIPSLKNIDEDIALQFYKKLNLDHSSPSQENMSDADGASGMSASKMREYAKNDDFKNFKRGLPSTLREAEAKQLMDAVQAGME